MNDSDVLVTLYGEFTVAIWRYNVIHSNTCLTEEMLVDASVIIIVLCQQDDLMEAGLRKLKKNLKDYMLDALIMCAI